MSAGNAIDRALSTSFLRGEFAKWISVDRGATAIDRALSTSFLRGEFAVRPWLRNRRLKKRALKPAIPA